MLSGKLKKKACKGMAGLLTAAMCATLIPCVTGGSKVSADVIKNQNDTYMGVSGITNPKKPEAIDSPWTGSYVYFGNYNMYPIKFRVLDKDSTAQTENESLFLDSDKCLFHKSYTEYSEDPTWENSTLRTFLNNDFFTTAFTGREQNAIVTSVYAGGEHYAEGTYSDYFFQETTPLNDKIFLLDVADILNEDYGYYPDDGQEDTFGDWTLNYLYHHVPNHIKTNFYYLRTHYKPNGGMPAGVYDGGALDLLGSSNPYTAIAPALCVDHESILFSSRVFEDYADGENEFRLTLIDEDMGIDITDGQYVLLDSEGAVTVPYTISGDNADSVSRVSVLILDREYTSGNVNNANIIYYDDIGGEFGENGMGVFELPEQLDMANWGKTYHVYIVAEEVNGWKHTDYASEPVEVYAPCNGWTLIDGDYYFYDMGEGEFITGWYKEDTIWYYMEPITKLMVKGWKFIDGFWYFFKPSGEMATNWFKIDGNWYYFGSNGHMRTEWERIDGLWYYFGTNGIMRTGWQKIDIKWYYFMSSGEMATGWLKDGDKWYYFSDNGAMVTGWLKLGDKWYYFEDNGAMVTGWKLIDGFYYYFKESGEMASGEYWNGYWLNPGGEWTYEPIAEWKTDAKGTYFEDTSGWYAKNQTLLINGVAYTFDASGYLIE